LKSVKKLIETTGLRQLLLEHLASDFRVMGIFFFEHILVLGVFGGLDVVFISFLKVTLANLLNRGTGL